MIIFPCQVCQTQLCADDMQAGDLVRCPNCSGTLRVPPQSASSAVDARRGQNMMAFNPAQLTKMGGLGTGGKRYGFNCGYCSSRLETTDAMAAHEGQCPTCGNNITIPILDRYGRLIDPKTNEIIKQDPHPVHAYAAAGDRAPKIQRGPDDTQYILCPRCSSRNQITSNNCKSCGMPFTMEGTTLDAGRSNGLCVASLVLGIIGIPSCWLVVPGALAIILGIIGYNQISNRQASRSGRGLAIAGITCGIIGAGAGLLFHIFGP